MWAAEQYHIWEENCGVCGWKRRGMGVRLDKQNIIEWWRLRDENRVGFYWFFMCCSEFPVCLPFYPIFNDSFGKWVLTSTFLCLLLHSTAFETSYGKSQKEKIGLCGFFLNCSNFFINVFIFEWSFLFFPFVK